MSIAEVQQLDEHGLVARDRHQAGGFVNLSADDFTSSDVTVPEALRSEDQVRQYIQPCVRGARSCLALVRETKSSRSAPTPMWLG